MPEPESDVALAMAMAAAAHGTPSPRTSAADVLDELCGHVPVAGAAISAFDAVTGTHTVLCSTGYPPEVLAHLSSPAFLGDDVGYRLLVDRPSVRARSWRDTHVDYARVSPSAVGVFRPAGYLGGATARLTTRDGRYTGDLHLSTTEPDLPTPRLTGTLHHVAPVLAAATDPVRPVTALLDGVDPEAAAAVVGHGGRVAALPGRTVPSELTGAHLRAVLAWRRAAADTGRFLLVGNGGWRRIRLTPVASGTLVVVEPVAAPHGITARELQVLTLVTEGLVNSAIARRLGVSERTVAHHVEHVLVKLAAGSRTAATRVAVEAGIRLLR